MDLLGAYASSNEDDDAMEEVVQEPSSAAPQPSKQERAGAQEGTQAAEEQEESKEGQDTIAGKRIAELNEVEESIAQLLHLAGCTLASLHPDPMSSFTSRTMSLDDDESEEGSPRPRPPPAPPGEEDKGADFAKYAEAYYTTLNDIQLSLRTSIRHLRLSRASPAPLLDPHFASLANTTSEGVVGSGGLALGDRLKPLTLEEPRWPGGGEEAPPKLSVGALKLEKEAWEALGAALGGGE
ncbi:hypothetical protein BCR35DRAFT_305630 [Leucosporidium creatinivorum]|uniref:Mediator of RNA polymerase II transcription subunit 11 n=1 Tax=Leucosporidium creatinivorum TaxID=106004 RepID=A0A1Y2EZ49_9BASI|nr:hypothetical protein BCR35DRAFT_305630 [Leucosporidium creatinivorum]